MREHGMINDEATQHCLTMSIYYYEPKPKVNVNVNVLMSIYYY